MYQSGEIEQVIAMFERTSQQQGLPYTGGSLDKAPRDEWKRRSFYNNGAVNSQFLAFLAGYSFGKSVAH